jgi:hypothetical protein
MEIYKAYQIWPVSLNRMPRKQEDDGEKEEEGEN